jgi:hypothetical protein
VTVSPTFGNQRIQKYINAGLATNQEYFYEVTSLAQSGESAPSEETSEVPSSACMPLNSSAWEVAQWASSQQYADNDGIMPFVSMQDITVMMPDEQYVTGDNPSQFQYNGESITLNSTQADYCPIPLKGEEAGAQISGISGSSARHLKIQMNPSTISYSQNASFPNLTYDTSRDTIINSYVPNLANQTYNVNSSAYPIRLEGMNIYGGFSSWNGGVPSTWLERRNGNINAEAGFQLNHYGDDPNAKALRFTPFFRHERIKVSNGTRYVLSGKVQTPQKFIRANVATVPGLGQIQTNIECHVEGDGNKDRYLSAKVTAPMGNATHMFVGSLLNSKLSRLGRSVRVKLGIGLDQTFNPPPSGTSWIPESNNIYFKIGRFATGSKGKVLVPSDALKFDDSDPNPPSGGTWDFHTTSNSTWTKTGGVWFGGLQN